MSEFFVKVSHVIRFGELTFETLFGAVMRAAYENNLKISYNAVGVNPMWEVSDALSEVREFYALEGVAAHLGVKNKDAYEYNLPDSTVDPEFLIRFINHDLQNNKIRAIKLVRGIYGLGLKESKDLVEQIYSLPYIPKY